jgi:Mrp family chromosome partitioning ATPase
MAKIRDFLRLSDSERPISGSGRAVAKREREDIAVPGRERADASIPGRQRSEVDEAQITLPMPRAFTPEVLPESGEPGAHEEMPFIEVGGKNGPVEGSSAVLAATVPSRFSPILPSATEPASKPAASRAESAQEPPMQRSFNFVPLPAEPRQLQPPARRFVPELVAFHHPDQPLSEQYRQLLTGIEAQLPAGQAHVVLFAGSSPEVDTTTVLLNTAISRARREAGDAIVIDADLRQPCVHERLGLFGEPGLRDVLTASVSLQRAIQETGQSNLYALTAGLGRAGEPGYLAGQAMRSILRHLRERFSITLIDAPFWDGRADLVSLAGICDAVYLILPESEMETPTVKQLTQIIMLEGVSLRGYISLPR